MLYDKCEFKNSPKFKATFILQINTIQVEAISYHISYYIMTKKN